jgi:putative endonuclease
MFFVYILQSLSSGKWYYGSANDPDRRLNQHNANANISTRWRGPWKRIFLRSFDRYEDALAFEKHLKDLRNKSYIKKEFNQYFVEAG